MLSMRVGQPFLAHSVGGLSDTIIDDENGFTFNGDNPLQQAENMLNCFEATIAKKKQKNKKWDEISENALKARFLWRDVAQDYVKYLGTFVRFYEFMSQIIDADLKGFFDHITTQTACTINLFIIPKI